jgi:hypothetical protein
VNFNAKPCNPHSVAGLLKLFLRELPEPPFTFAAYDEWCTVADLRTLSVCFYSFLGLRLFLFLLHLLLPTYYYYCHFYCYCHLHCISASQRSRLTKRGSIRQYRFSKRSLFSNAFTFTCVCVCVALSLLLFLTTAASASQPAVHR